MHPPRPPREAATAADGAEVVGAMLGTALVGDLIILPAVLIGPIGRLFERRRTPRAERDFSRAA